MSANRFSSVWDALETSPAQAETMRLRAELMTALKDHIGRQGWTQTEAAKRLGLTQPRVSDLMRGKISLFALDALVNAVSAAGLQVEIRVRDAA